MSGPKKSTRPRSRSDSTTRPRSRSDSEGMAPKVLEGSTRSIDGLNMAERAALTAKETRLDRNKDGIISGPDFKKDPKKMKAGGRAGSEKPDDSKAKKSGTLATHNSRGERIRSDEAATKWPMDFTGVASQSRGHKSKSDMFSDFGRHESGGGPTPTKNRTGRAGPKVVKKKASGGKIKSKGMAMGGKVKAKGMAMGGKIKSKGMAMGGKVKAKGMAMGGKIKSKGMAMGGKVKAKGMAMGGVATSKGAAMGGRGFGAARSSGQGTRIF